MSTAEFAVSYHLDMINTVGVAALVLVLGKAIKYIFPTLAKFYIPAPVIGGIIFSIVTLIGYKTQLFYLTYDEQLKNLLMMAFFTSVGYLASFKMLLKGGISVILMLICAVVLIVLQNGLGVYLAKAFGLNPLLGLAIGSIPLSGGHGTSAAFGPILEQQGLEAGLSISVAAATFGLVAGSLFGGPVGKRLLQKYNLHQTKKLESNKEMIEGVLTIEEKLVDEKLLFKASAYLVIAMLFGTFLTNFLKDYNIILPAYIGPMIIAAVIRNALDFSKKNIPIHAIDLCGSFCLQFFLAMALMTMKLWQLQELAIPLITILMLQTILVICYTYFVTFRVMRKDYDAAVISCGHVGFALGATPNAMANIQTFTGANGYSPKAFFVIPIVGSLFIDFFNAFIITTFIKLFS